MAACKGCDKDDAKAAQENYDDGMSPSERMDAIKAIFVQADTDGDKLIDMKEWKASCKKKDGKKYNEAETEKEFKLIDQSNSGSISLAELDLHIVNLQMKAVRVKFKTADSSGDRKLDKKEFGAFFKAEGMKTKAIGRLWKKCDKNGDGKVSYTEFSDWMEREMADGVLAETFKDMFSADAKANKDVILKKDEKAPAKKEE